MDSLKCQTSTATPAEPGGLLVLLVILPIRSHAAHRHTAEAMLMIVHKILLCR